MPKNKILPKIPVLPRELRDGFFGADTRGWKFKKEDGLDELERKAIAPILEIGKFNTVEAIPEVDYPLGVKTPDLWIDRKTKAEIKMPERLGSLDSHIRKSKQQTQGGFLVISTDLLSDEDKVKIKEVIKSSRRGTRGFVVGGGNIQYGFISEKPSETTLQHGVRNPEDYHTKIISRNSEKIKEIFGQVDGGDLKISDKMKEVAVRSPIGGLRRATSNDFIISEDGKKVNISSTNPDELGIKIHNSIKLNSSHTHVITKKNAAGSNPGIDSVLDGNTSALSVTDKSVSNLILTQNIKKVNDLIKVVGGGEIKFGFLAKENNSATAVHQGVHDSELFHTKIISRNSEKIKEIFDNKKNSLTELYPKQDQTASGFIISHTHGYWQNRAIANFERNEAETGAYSRRIARIYADSERKIIAEIKKLYANYYRSDQTFDLQALNSIEPAGNVANFKAEMKRLGLETHLPDNYAFRMTRLEMLQKQLWAEIKSAGFKHTDAQTASATSTIKNSYGRAITDAERKFGSIGAFAKLDNQTLTRILNSKIEGTHFSSRIWKNTDVLAEQVNSKLASAIAIGQSPEKTIREIRERFDVGRFYAERLVRTESAFYHNLAQLEAYRQMGAEKYQLIATLDGKTSQICQHKHHRIFAVKDAEVGENFPPFHPMCRTATVAYFGEAVPELERAPAVETSSQDRGVSKVKPLDEPQIKNSFKENASTAYKSGGRPRFKQDHAKIQAFVEDLGRIENKTAKRLYDMITGKVGEAKIVPLTKKQQEIYGFSGYTDLVMTNADFRHLINSGHITGQKKNGNTDKNPLSAQDFANIYKVFRNPDTVARSDRDGCVRFKLEKVIEKQHRLILEVEEDKNRLRVVTFFNVS